jgi:phosphatidylglycerophosphatase C
MIKVSSLKKHEFARRSSAKKQLVLFDFDGTITTKDTLAEFMKFYHGEFRYMVGLAMLSPILASYVLKLMPNWRSKQYFLSWFLKGETTEIFERKCREFLHKRLPDLIRPKALEAIKTFKKNGAVIAVVSASPEAWVKPWCDKHKLICISTRLETNNGHLTGKILGRNCHGPEKVCRVREEFDLSRFNEIIAYGDTSGDREMLGIAHIKHYKPFRD